jgi:hypothetical protein
MGILYIYINIHINIHINIYLLVRNVGNFREWSSSSFPSISYGQAIRLILWRWSDSQKKKSTYGDAEMKAVNLFSCRGGTGVDLFHVYNIYIYTYIYIIVINYSHIYIIVIYYSHIYIYYSQIIVIYIYTVYYSNIYIYSHIHIYHSHIYNIYIYRNIHMHRQKERNMNNNTKKKTQ